MTTRPLRTTRTGGPDGVFPNQCFVYWNLREQCWSLRSQDPAIFPGIAVAHARIFKMNGVIFKVSEAGRQRVLRTGQKNVHAGVVGSIVGFLGVDNVMYGEDPGDERYFTHFATYNPRRFPTFRAGPLINPEESMNVVTPIDEWPEIHQAIRVQGMLSTTSPGLLVLP